MNKVVLMFILFLGFNTASGKYYCNKSLTRLILELNCKCFNTASGKYYCNCIMIFNDMSLGNEVSTPQAVGTIAILHVVQAQ